LWLMIFSDWTIANIQYFSLEVIVEYVPQYPILIYYGFDMYICKIHRPASLQIM
jgi:hypothetical protein